MNRIQRVKEYLTLINEHSPCQNCVWLKHLSNCFNQKITAILIKGLKDTKSF